MANDDDFILLIDDEVSQASGVTPLAPWKIAVVDDDPAVHDGTRFALQDYTLGGRSLELMSARSAAEGRALLAAHPDTAVVLLDVVMETDGAGLDLVNFIRRDLGNELVRIILRTGQPGQAPEQRIIVDYDINDYKAKTELTADKFFTTLTVALRSYDQLRRLEETRRGLEIIVDAAADVFDFRSLRRLAEGVLTQIAALIDADCAGILVLRENREHESFSVLAGSGRYRDIAEGQTALDGDLHGLLGGTFANRRHSFLAKHSLLYLATGSGREIVVLVEAPRPLSDTDRSLIEVFSSRLSIAFDNVTLYEQLQAANDCLEERVEQRTRELTAANERLHAQWARLRSADAFKNEVLGTVAHDLKNPLNVILGRTEMLTNCLDVSPLPQDQARAQIEHIRKAVRGLTGMVDSLIQDAMADALDITIQRRPFDLAALAADVTEANRALASRKGQRLTLTGPSGLMVTGDEDRLSEVIDNLLSNAVKYTPVGGAIRIALSRGDRDIRLAVSDTGPGLSPEDVARLFGRFQRLSAKPTGGESSTGLGLSIAKRIVELHEGRIEVGAPDGGGAVFTIVLPA